MIPAPPLPVLFALLGTALMAIVIFAPRRAAAVAPSQVSYAPPVVEAVERWSVPAASDDDPFAIFAAAAAPAAPAWPEAIDPRASGCDRAARCAIAGALVLLGTPWAQTILSRADGEETDPDVRAVLLSGRTSP